MGLLIDLHVHTRRHSTCSHINPKDLIRQAVRAGLDGLVITEHHYQWPQDEIDALTTAASDPGFLVLAGFEYASQQGDVLIYGLEPGQARDMLPGLPPQQAVKHAHDLGGVCIAAHPTRAGMGFDERIFTLGIDGIEIQSVNLKPHEQRLAAQLASNADLRPVTSSDAHQLSDVGKYATRFDDPIRSMQDLVKSIRCGRFRPATYKA